LYYEEVKNTQSAKEMEVALQEKFNQQSQDLRVALANLDKQAQDLKAALANAVAAREQAQQAAADALGKTNAQNAQLVDANAQLKSENDALKAQIAALTSQTKVAGPDQQPQPVIKLGPTPFKDDYAGEAADCKGNSQETLQKDVSSPTPCMIPGGTVLTTKLVYNAVATGKLKGAAFLIVDVWDEPKHPTIPTAQRLPYAGAGGDFTDNVQQKLFEDMKKLTKGNWGTPVIFFCHDAKSWEAYNASLRAIEMGMTQVFWYRGGLAAWQEASQPVEQVQPADKPTDPPKGSP
jgi:PQQ-dependent catabolism-associated CXXCW motif protein